MEAVSSEAGAVVDDWIEARDSLRQWREESSRKSLRAVELGTFLLMHKKSDLGNEAWSVYEQTCIAALDCGDISLAKDCVANLSSQFPESLRVSRLSGLCSEAEEKYKDVEETYDRVLKEHPSCAAVWKRKVAILKTQGKTIEAIKELTQFLLVFMTDSEAWLELADLYVEINELGRAGFCLEELILANPHHYLYHLKYAEICYSFGSAERIELARKHYATAVKLNPCNMRALYGFYLTPNCSICARQTLEKCASGDQMFCVWMAENETNCHNTTRVIIDLVCQWTSAKGRQSDSKSKSYQYVEWAKMQIKRCYQFDDHKFRIVEKMLDKQI